MRVFSVFGTQGSGKTSTIEVLIRELRRRGFSVGSIKEIHNEAFHIDTPGSNTDRHRQAGAQLVCARGLNETDLLYQEKLTLNCVLRHFDFDFVVCEGITEPAIPKIITGLSAQDLENRWIENIFAISGRAADMLDQFQQVQAISAFTDPVRLTELAIKKAVEFINVEGRGLYQILARFPSRRNQVFTVRSNYKQEQAVLKKFNSSDNLKKELLMMFLLRESGIPVPQVLSFSADSILTEHIEAPTLYEYLDRAEFQGEIIDSDFLKAWMRQMRILYSTAYIKASGIALHDVNLRNFLIRENNVIFLDFEEAGPGSIIDDLAGIIAFILTYDPVFTGWKQELACRLAEIIRNEFAVSSDSLRSTVNKRLKLLNCRRKAKEKYPDWDPRSLSW